MVSLAEKFPNMRGRPGVRPWDPDRLDRDAAAATSPGAELHTVRFLLNLWNGYQRWRCGRFNLLDALDHWDAAHRAAFAAWSIDPWWPSALSWDTHDTTPDAPPAPDVSLRAQR